MFQTMQSPQVVLPADDLDELEVVPPECLLKQGHHFVGGKPLGLGKGEYEHLA